VHVGDKIIVIAYASMDIKEADEYAPSIVIVDENNDVLEHLSHL
jgi:aspartate 1-decarboxylase